MDVPRGLGTLAENTLRQRLNAQFDSKDALKRQRRRELAKRTEQMLKDENEDATVGKRVPDWR